MDHLQKLLEETIPNLRQEGASLYIFPIKSIFLTNH